VCCGGVGGCGSIIQTTHPAAQVPHPAKHEASPNVTYQYLLLLLLLLQALSKAPESDLTQLLEYHILPTMRPVPTGWKNGESVKTTLAGHSIKAQLGQR
jgi:hypothetical protein